MLVGNFAKRTRFCVSSHLIQWNEASGYSSIPGVFPAVHSREDVSDSPAAVERTNPLGIQLLSRSLFRQIFHDESKGHDRASLADPNVAAAVRHLKSHDLWGKETTVLPDLNLSLPQLKGSDIDEHFRRIAEDQAGEYKRLLISIAGATLPPRPHRWEFRDGWTAYDASSGKETPVAFPDDDALVFDVEVLVKEGSFPALAVAVSESRWYSWCSQRLVEKLARNDVMRTTDLIPLEDPNSGSRRAKIVVGHNVAFDRSYVAEQYAIEPGASQARFVDTMSMHIANGGFSCHQRDAYQVIKKKESKINDDEKGSISGSISRSNELRWSQESTTNALSDLYKFYCKKTLSKDARDVFVKGSLDDVLSDFQNLTDYCAWDVAATHEILSHLTPEFFERFPHPVTFAGMLEMARVFLPVDDTWHQFIENCDNTRRDLLNEQRKILLRLANKACSLAEGELYKKDPWLWNLDWSTSTTKLKKAKKPSPSDKAVQKTKEQLGLLSPEGIRNLCTDFGFPIEKDENAMEVLMNPLSLNEIPLNKLRVVELKTLCRIHGLPSTAKKGVLYDRLVNLGLREKEKSESGQFCNSDENQIQDISILLATRDRLHKSQRELVGYPEWYRKTYLKSSETSTFGSFGPSLTTKLKETPSLLRMTYVEFPLHYHEKLKWGYLVPHLVGADHMRAEDGFPFGEIYKICKHLDNNTLGFTSPQVFNTFNEWNEIEKRLETKEDFATVWEDTLQLLGSEPPEYTKKLSPFGPYYFENIPGCSFYRIPHPKFGPSVGDPLGKHFISRLAGTMVTKKARFEPINLYMLGGYLNDE